MQNGVGQQMICEFWGATNLDDVATTERALRDAVRAGGATLVEIFVHRFSPHGISGIAVIAESHLAIHTWPEMGYCAADFFTCGDSVDMNAIVRTLRDAYQADQVDVRTLPRGVRPGEYTQASFQDTTEGRPSIAFGIDTILERRQTRHQELLLFESNGAGRVLALDGALRTTGLDAAAYYETLVHPALHCHPDPRRVAIVGGVDLHSLTEALHHEVESVDLIEADDEAIRIAQQYYEEVQGSLDDRRVHLHTGDIVATLQNCRDIDVAIIDPVDRIGSTVSTAFRALIDAVEGALAPDGIVVLPTGIAHETNSTLRDRVRALEARFPHTELLWTTDATAPGSLSTFACASRIHDPREVRRFPANIQTEWYDRDMHNWYWLPTPKRKQLVG